MGRIDFCIAQEGATKGKDEQVFRSVSVQHGSLKCPLLFSKAISSLLTIVNSCFEKNMSIRIRGLSTTERDNEGALQ